MPNWCETEIRFVCENENRAMIFQKSVLESLKSIKMKNDFGDYWLGNILLNLDLATVEPDENEKDGTAIKTPYRCRGSVSDIYQSLNEVVIYTVTAWAPLLRMWTAVADKILGKGNYEKYYTAKEYLGNICDTNDPDMIDCVSVSFFDHFDVLENAFYEDDQDEIEFIEMLYESEYGESILVHKYKFTDWDKFD